MTASWLLTTLALLGALLALALLTLTFLDAVRARLLQRLSLRLDRLVTPILMKAVLRRAGREGPGEAQGVVREFDVVRQALSGPAAQAVLDAPWAPLYLLVCFLIHPWLGVLVLVGGALLLGVAVLNERALRRDIGSLSTGIPAFYAAQESELGAAGTIRALGMQGIFVRRQIESRNALNDVQADAAFRGASYSGASKFLRLALQSAALGLGAYLTVRGEMSPGALIAGSILTSRALAPIEQIVGAWRQLMLGRKAYAKITAFLGAEPAEPEAMALPAPRGEVRLERVSLRVPKTERWAVLDVTAAVPVGQMVGIVGSSGAGKSTLARLIAGAVPPDTGVVRLDSANLRDWQPDALGAHVGYLPQDVGLLAGTIAENICRFTRRGENAAETDAAIVAAAQEADAHEMILRLPKGYNSVLGPGGAGLSPGQAQRVALARALYGEPALLVLDEPNAHLDAEGEGALIKALQRARVRGATVFLIAHRAGVLAGVDMLMVMREGRLEHFADRDEVMRRMQGGAPAPARAGADQLTPPQGQTAPAQPIPAAAAVAAPPRRVAPVAATQAAPVARPAVPVGEAPPPRFTDKINRDLSLGIAAAAAFFGIVLGWAAFAPLDAGVVARGEIVVAGDRQAVQHREGGVVRQINVSEGQHVEEGQVLIELAAAEVLAQQQAAASQMFELQLQRAQLIAEAEGRRDIQTPADWANLDPAERAIADTALQRHNGEMRARNSAARSLSGSSELDARIAGARQQIEALDRQKVLVAEELAGMEKLREQDLVPLSRIRGLQGKLAELDGQRAQLTAQVAQLRDDRAERQREVEAAISQLAPRLQGLREQLERTRLRAPAAGVVLGLSAKTVGGVIAPGAVVMEIVPDSRRLLIAAQVSPQDADDLSPGMKTQVRITAFTGRNLPIVHGVLQKVSADRLVDQRSGLSYFRADVEVPDGELTALRNVEGGRSLRPGLPAEVVIPTRKRTALQYLLEPLGQTLWRSFREG